MCNLALHDETNGRAVVQCTKSNSNLIFKLPSGQGLDRRVDMARAIPAIQTLTL